MPVDKIITYTFGIIATLAVLHGPLHLRDEMRKIEIQILRETARTNNWGNPSIFAGRRPAAHMVTRLFTLNAAKR